MLITIEEIVSRVISIKEEEYKPYKGKVLHKQIGKMGGNRAKKPSTLNTVWRSRTMLSKSDLSNGYTGTQLRAKKQWYAYPMFSHNR